MIQSLNEDGNRYFDPLSMKKVLTARILMGIVKMTNPNVFFLLLKTPVIFLKYRDRPQTRRG